MSVCVSLCNGAISRATLWNQLYEMLCRLLLVSTKPHSSVSQHQNNSLKPHSVLTPQLHTQLRHGQSI